MINNRFRALTTSLSLFTTILALFTTNSFGSGVAVSSSSSSITSDQGSPNTAANAWPVKVTDGTDTALVSGTGALLIDGSATTQPVSGTFWQATQPVSAASLPLPSGASTEATLAAQSAKLPATLGQKTMANSLAVAIASDQGALVTTPTAATLNLSGTIGANNTDAFSTDLQAYLGGVYTFQLSGTWSATVSVQGSNDNTNWSNVIAFGTAGTNTTSLTSTGTYFVSVMTRYMRIRTTSYSSGSVVATAVVSANSAGFFPIAPITAVTQQGTWSTRLLDGAGTSVTVGSKVSASSLPVVIASDQGAVPASQSGTWNITNVSGTVSLPTGAATAANQLKNPINTTGSICSITNLTTAAQTCTAPANAVAFMIQSTSANSANIRFAVGATATSAVGLRLEPGRSEYVPLGANVSVIAESGSSQEIQLQWVAQ